MTLGHVEVPAFAAAIEGHQRRISEAILNHALKICLEKNVSFYFLHFRVNVCFFVDLLDCRRM